MTLWLCWLWSISRGNFVRHPKLGLLVPMAWVTIAPQSKSVMPQYIPETIFLPEGKFVVFK